VIRRGLVLLGRHGPPLLAGGIFLGLLLPGLAALLRPLLQALVFVLAAATMARIDWSQVTLHVRQPLRVALALAWALLVSPVATFLVVRQLALPESLTEAIVIWSASSPLISAPALAFLLGLNGSLSLVLVVGGSMVMPLTLPPLVLELLGTHLEIGALALSARLVLFFGGAAALASLVRSALGAARITRLGEEFNGINVLLLVLFAIAVMDGIDAIALARPSELALYVAAAFSGALLHLLLGTLIFLWCGAEPALTVGLTFANRNLASVWASLGSFATPELTLFLAMLQLPIYILPFLLRPLFRRVTGRARPR
jgi:BASS family bile acid:Na+ symporter